MFHYFQYDTLENNRLEAKFRYDICSGKFRHINSNLIDQIQIILLNQQNQVLLTKDNDNNWSFISTTKSDENSPKQAILHRLRELGITVNLKTLEQFCYQKTLEPLEYGQDKNGNPIWDMTSCQVVYVAQILESKLQATTFEWVEISQIPDYIKSIFGLQKTVEVVAELLKNFKW